MEDKYCQSCIFFRQHYSLDEERLFLVYCGHCSKSVRSGRKRNIKPDTPACEQYFPTDSPKNTFVTREYLNKRLLEYVLALPLLPEIEKE